MPTKNPARYAVTYGMAGGYMPDNHEGAHQFDTRADLAAFIRAELALYEMPACLFDEVHIRRLWGFIQRHGSSTAHFHLTHKGYSLAFHGLTSEEYEADAEEA